MGKSKDLATRVGIDDNADATAITITSQENVGIGTASPSNYGAAYTSLGVSGSSASAIEGFVGSNLVGYLQAYNAQVLVGSKTNVPLKLVTNDTVQMTIDGSGRVTMPNQPMFHAWNSTNDTFQNSDAKHNFNSTRINVGSHFDTSNYRFVAPIAGYYFFTWGGTISSGGAGDAYVTAYLRKNGSTAGGMRTRFHTTTSSTVYAGMAGAEVQYMAANDYMEVWHYSQNGSAYSVSPEYVFTGYLIG